MGVLLQGFFKLRPNRAVPSPADGNPAVPWWWDYLATQANALRKSGFSAVWLPPVMKTLAGAQPAADGYGPFDDYDIGSKDQKGSVPTRFGTREALQRCVAVLRANGLDVYGDLIEHRRVGDPGDFVFRYKGAEGVPDIGRFPKDKLNFRPNVPRDPNRPAQDDLASGRELAPINGQPPGYVSNGLTDAADWLIRGLDLQGYRVDDVSRLSTDFLFPFLNSKAMAGKFAIGAFADDDRARVSNWVFNPGGMRGRASAFDFPLRLLLARMCNNPGGFNMADLDHAGLAGIAPFNSVTFVENHETDLTDPIFANKILGYAYILTSEGYPSVYYRDYATDADCYRLKPFLDDLIWIHEHLANGVTRERWKDFNLFIYERQGAPGLLVGLNNDPNGPRTVEVATAFGANARLHDYSGNAADIVTTGAGTAIITVPRNADGHGYVCYSRPGINGVFPIAPRSVTQDFEGAPDLDLPPADAARAIQIGRLWCEAGTRISATPAVAGLVDPARVTIEVKAPDGAVLAQAISAPGAPATATADAARTGFHSLAISLTGAPAGARPAFRLSSTYTASTMFGQTAADIGEWGAPFAMPNAAIHSHLLPNGKVLFWGRRDLPAGTLDDHFCTPQLWDPVTRTAVATPQPMRADGTKVNLFCSGHALLPDGRLLVAGGHFRDSVGLDQACVYDFRTDAWTPLPAMNHGRWYPAVVTLANGHVAVLSGSFATTNGGQVQNNNIPQVWNGVAWRELTVFPGDGVPKPSPIELYPCLHLAPDGRIFMSGPGARAFFLDTPGGGTWTMVPGAGGLRENVRRDYAPSVMCDVGKIIYIGGGNDQGPVQDQIPSAEVETIDLTAPAPAWQALAPMHFARRQHNATVLPDGTVLVTGGTRGPGFNDLTQGGPVHAAELWNPATRTWSVVASEAVDRCYHATAILLPDATVLSAGGGEFDVGNNTANPPRDTHRDAQIYRPPYLFRGPRPEITAAPAEVGYGASFTVGTPAPAEIGKVTWIRLPSTTHTNNMNQRINVLDFSVSAGALRVTSPARPELCPPGHYMLFVLSRNGVPSVARIIRISVPATVAVAAAAGHAPTIAPPRPAPTLEEVDRRVRETATGTQVAVGLTSKCPYGLGACWGGAFEALTTLDGVTAVRPVANADDSTADVWLGRDSLPNVDLWAEQIARKANGSYDFRGVEVSISGVPVAADRGLELTGPALHRPLPLRALEEGEKIQFDRMVKRPRPATPEERASFGRLAQRVDNTGAFVRVTGPLVRDGDRFVLHVRAFEPV